jgi:hypothetical protein
MSMMTSNTKSTMNETKTVDCETSILSMVQLTESGDQLERIYGFLVSKSSWSETVEFENSPVRYL